MRRPTRTLALAGVMLAGCAQARTAEIPEPAPILQSRSHRLRAATIGDDYRITVMLPRSYERDSTRRYPVVVLTDGNWLGPVAAPLAWDLSTVRHPEVILVGIDHAVERFGDTGERRLRDLTPEFVPRRQQAATPPAGPAPIQSGGGPAFLNFIAAEVLPFVDTRYRTLPSDRTLAGYSLGGLFTLYALVERPTLFRRYIAISPSLWWANAATMRRLEQLSRTPAIDSMRVFVSIGASEGQNHIGRVQTVETAIRKWDGGAPNFAFHVFPEEIHESGWPGALSRGLRFVFGMWPPLTK